MKDQAIWLKRLRPDTEITILAPHYAHGHTDGFSARESYDEFRFHYFWPRRWERLAGRGMLPALRENRLLYLQIPAFVVFQLIALYRLVRRTNPDLLYAHWFTPQAITTSIVARLCRIPFVFTTHASDVAILRKLPLSRRLVRAVCSRAAAFTAVSERTAAKLEAFFGEREWCDSFASKLHVIPMGVDPRSLEVGEGIVREVRQRYGIGDDKHTVLFLGRLAEKKGVTFLLDAAAQLPPELRSKLRIVIAGGGALRERLESYAKKLDVREAVFTGYVHGEEKAALLKLTDVVCLPSIVDSYGDSEGFPVVLMESLAAGKVVVASDASGAELILQHEKNGFIFEQKSAPALGNVLEQAVGQSRETRVAMEMRAQHLAVRFGWSAVAEQHLQIFDKVADASTC